MALDIEYRDASHRSQPFGGGRLVRRTEARLGDIRREGANRSEAKAALLDALTAQAANAYARRYLVGVSPDGEQVTFALSYTDGWRYDIIHASGRYSSTMMGEETERGALDRMRAHFEQYTEAADPAVEAASNLSPAALIDAAAEGAALGQCDEDS